MKDALGAVQSVLVLAGASEIGVALAAGREVIWVPAVLRVVFSVFRHLPRPLWRRLPV